MDGETKFPVLRLGKSSKSAKSERYSWPNPEASTGEHYKNANLGRNKCWEAVGEARQKFEEIASEIKIHLEKCSDPIARPVIWTIYMIGRTREESTPTIMFCGRDKNARIEVKDTIKKSGIMDRHPGVRIGSCTEEFRHYARAEPTVPTCSGSPVEAMRTMQNFHSDTRSEIPILHDHPYITTCSDDREFRNATEDVEDRQQTHIATAAGAAKAILYSASDAGPGMRILIRGFHGDSSSLRPATGGGFICHQGSTFLITVAHAFHEDAANALPSPPENCEFEFELDDDSEEEDYIEMSSRGSVSPEPSDMGDSTVSGITSSDTSSEFDERSMIVSDTDHMLNRPGAHRFPVRNPIARAQAREQRLPVKSDDLLLPVGEHIILSTTGSRPGLDYCLIEIEANKALKSKQFPPKFDQPFRPIPSGVVMSEPKDVDVIAATASGGLLRGRLSGTPSFLMLPGSNSVQEVWTVRHDTEIFNGDCGAWVVDASNGDLFGHIVGGSPSLEVSYIIPAHLILDDLKERFDGDWKLCTQKRKLTGGRLKPSPFLNLTHKEWNPIFTTRREDVQYAVENKPLIEMREPEDGVVRRFMKNFDESDTCLFRADKVEQFCFGATLEALQAEKGEISEPIAWLDERSSAGGKEQARRYRGPLTASQLYQELKRPRFRISGPPGTSKVTERGSAETATNDNLPSSLLESESDSINPNPDEQQPQEPDREPDAERRKIFITNLDRWSIYALIGTASKSQALGLRDAIYKHLAFENFIGVTIPPIRVAMFQLAFHIPFYVWRTSNILCKDSRIDANANRLRQCRDVSLLNWKSSGPSDFLYEAQMSCLVTGEDESRWVAYGFIDTYFDAIDGVKETVEAYHEDAVTEGGINADPLTFGVFDAEKTIQTPREYFLTVLRVRIAQVTREWERVVAKVGQSIREYEQSHQYSSCMPRERSSSTAAEHNEMVRKSFDWVLEVKRLTTLLLQSLSKTVDACENFCLNDAIYFQNLYNPLDGKRSLVAIQVTFDKLESLKKELGYIAERCSQFAKDLELQLIFESIEVGNFQHKIAKENKTQSMIMMFYFSPIALAAGILSMSKDVITFIPVTFGSFIGLVFVFGVLGILIQFILQYHNWNWQMVMTLTRQRRWQGMLLRRKSQGDEEQPLLTEQPARSTIFHC